MPRRRNPYAHRNPPSARQRRRALVPTLRQKQRVVIALKTNASRLVRQGLADRLAGAEEAGAAESQVAQTVADGSRPT